MGGSGTCLIKNCSKLSLECLTDGQCRKATACNTGCPVKKNADACNLLCELNYGYNSTKLVPDNGANDTDTVKNLTSGLLVSV